MHGKKKCLFHLGNNARELGARGGRRRAVFNPTNLEPFAAPKNAMDLLVMLSQTIVEVRAAKLDPKTANAIAYLGTSFLRAIEIADLDARLKTLEAKRDDREHS